MKCVHPKSDGSPCGNWAMKGGTLCAKHGGKAPQIMAANRRNQALAKAYRMVQLAGVDQSPGDHALDCLYRSSALMQFWGAESAALADDQMYTVNKLGDRKPHPAVIEYQAALDRRMRFAKLCSDMGIAERQVALAERMGEQLSMLWERTMNAIDGLTEAQRLQAAKAYAREIALLERPVIDGAARDVA